MWDAAWLVVRLGLLAGALVLGGCGGGGAQSLASEASSRGNSNLPALPTPLFQPSLAHAQICAAPRAPDRIDPDTGLNYGDLLGSLNDEKLWIRSWVNETYLWYREVPEVDPTPYIVGVRVPYIEPADNNPITIALNSNHAAVDAYFNSQRTLTVEANGRPRDRFHFTYPTSDWQALSRYGNPAGFGMHITLVHAAPPRLAVVTLVDAGTPAALAGLGRGAQILSVDDAAVLDSDDVATLNEGLYAPLAGKTYRFIVVDRNSDVPRSIQLTAANLDLVPVSRVGALPAPNQRVGYLQFTDHIATAEPQLIAAVSKLQQLLIGDLVLDIRYNGGGLLNIASELAYMIAGPAATRGKVFERLSFNDKNPFDLSADDAATPFLDTSQGYAGPSGVALPHLDLQRVFVLTSGDTCSASESIINGLRGVGVQVIQIGQTTCGKPYGFLPIDNCDTTYFTIQFQGVNDQGYGGYTEGFTPDNGSSTASLPGCAVGDDFTHELGDPNEARLQAALQYLATGSCRSTVTKAAAQPPGASSGRALQPPALRSNRFYSAQGHASKAGAH